MSGAPGPDGRHDDLDDDELAGLALLVPDDARSLDADRAAYLTELRDRRAQDGGRPRRSGRGGVLRDLGEVLAGRRFRGLGAAVPVIVLVLAAMAVVGSSLSIFTPGGSATNALVTPLASDPPAAVGSVGGLLPDTSVSVDGVHVPLRSARPALIVLVPTRCASCGPVLDSLLMQGREYGLRLVLAGPSTQGSELAHLDEVDLGGSGLVAVDLQDALTPAYQPDGVTAVLVHEDGVVGAVVRDVTADQRLETGLAQLDRPGATAGAAPGAASPSNPSNPSTSP